MKKFSLGLVVMFLIGLMANVYAARDDMFSTGAKEEFRIDSTGRPLTEAGSGFDITWIDEPSASSTTFTSVNGLMIATATLVSGGTTLVDGAAFAQGANTFLQITAARNIVCQFGFLVGMATTTANGTLVITGTNAKGKSETETLLFSTGTATRPGKGLVAWSWIDSFQVSTAAISGASGTDGISTCTVHIGLGSKIGFSQDIIISTDVCKITVDYVDYSSATWKSIDATYDTIDPSVFSSGLPPNAARDYRVRGHALKSH